MNIIWNLYSFENNDENNGTQKQVALLLPSRRLKLQAKWQEEIPQLVQ
ncbi:hypothetical protein [Peribacillus sp. FSL M8-0224]